jgi:hypothetical protein
VERALDKTDHIQESYFGNLDGENGFLALSKTKLLFVREKGFLRHQYNVQLDLSYQNIGKLDHKGTHNLEFVEVNGKKHSFKTDFNISHLEDSLTQLMKSTPI